MILVLGIFLAFRSSRNSAGSECGKRKGVWSIDDQGLRLGRRSFWWSIGLFSFSLWLSKEQQKDMMLTSSELNVQTSKTVFGYFSASLS